MEMVTSLRSLDHRPSAIFLVFQAIIAKAQAKILLNNLYYKEVIFKLGQNSITSHDQTGGGYACRRGPEWRWRQRRGACPSRCSGSGSPGADTDRGARKYCESGSGPGPSGCRLTWLPWQMALLESGAGPGPLRGASSHTGGGMPPIVILIVHWASSNHNHYNSNTSNSDNIVQIS